jgi:hypothetical protein
MSNVERELTIEELGRERVEALPDRELMSGLKIRIKISGLLNLRLKLF